MCVCVGGGGVVSAYVSIVQVCMIVYNLYLSVCVCDHELGNNLRELQKLLWRTRYTQGEEQFSEHKNVYHCVPGRMTLTHAPGRKTDNVNALLVSGIRA